MNCGRQRMRSNQGYILPGKTGHTTSLQVRTEMYVSLNSISLKTKSITIKHAKGRLKNKSIS